MIICDDPDYAVAAEIYAEKLGIPNHVIIAIALHKNIDVSGYCYPASEQGLDYYMVGIETLEEDGEDHPLEILAHEMVHVSQYVSGDLADIDENTTLWKGKEYKRVERGSSEYYFAPFEVAAYGLQRALFNYYCEVV